METMYETDDYVMAREIPGRVSFTRLVTAEVSIDAAPDTSDLVRLNFLVKNDELPLNANNHCRQVFDLLRVAIAHNYDWQSLDRLQSPDAAPASESEPEPSCPAPLNTILN